MRFDDREWEELWERTLGQIERHRLAMSLLRREVPDDILGRRVVPELARRWRLSAMLHIIGHTLHATFWFLISLSLSPLSGTSWQLANGMTLMSLAVIAFCIGFRRYLHPVAALA